jgi:hypothetical protein
MLTMKLWIDTNWSNARYFIGTALDELTESYELALADLEEGGLRDVSGGAKQVEIEAVEIDGASASVTAVADIWLDTDPVDPDGEWPGAHTSDTGRFELHLTLVDDQWLIDHWSATPSVE